MNTIDITLEMSIFLKSKFNFGRLYKKIIKTKIKVIHHIFDDKVA
jgi:hypothetical protein